MDFIVKLNPQRQDKAAWVRHLDAAQAFEQACEGKRVGYRGESVERSIGKGTDKLRRSLRLVVEVTERTIDKRGQRLLGQLGFGGKITPLRHPARRRRSRTVRQEIMCRAAKVAWHARGMVLDFGRGVAAHAQVFIELHARLARACAP